MLDSRPTEDGSAIRRRRECPQCSHRFTTYERLEEPPILVVKKDGRREVFDRQKMLGGLLKACEKRPVPLASIEALVDSVEAAIRQEGPTEVTSLRLGDLVMERLRDVDGVAYVRFASVYRQFQDIERFRQAVDELLRDR